MNERKSIIILLIISLIVFTSCSKSLSAPQSEPSTTPAPVETPAPSSMVETNRPKRGDETDRKGYKVVRIIDDYAVSDYLIRCGDLRISGCVKYAANEYAGQDVYIPVRIYLIDYEPGEDEKYHLYLPQRVMELIRLQELGYDLYAPENDGYAELYGFLTPEQALNFSADPEIGYDIYYNDVYSPDGYLWASYTATDEYMFK